MLSFVIYPESPNDSCYSPMVVVGLTLQILNIESLEGLVQ